MMRSPLQSRLSAGSRGNNIEFLAAENVSESRAHFYGVTDSHVLNRRPTIYHFYHENEQFIFVFAIETVANYKHVICMLATDSPFERIAYGYWHGSAMHPTVERFIHRMQPSSSFMHDCAVFLDCLGRSRQLSVERRCTHTNSKKICKWTHSGIECFNN